MALRNAIETAVKSAYIHARLTEERLRSGVAWWPLAPSFVADPYPVYRKLRDRDPVHYSTLTRQFVVSRYTDLDRILRDHRNFSSDLQRARSSHGSLGTRKKLKPSMLVRDPPDHTRLRRLVNRAFTTRSVAIMEDYVRATAQSLLDRVAGAREFDLMSAFAAPLPALVIARMIGVPERDLDRFMVWSDRLARAVEPLLTRSEEKDVFRTTRELAEYHATIVERRRREPRDDLVSRIVEAEEQGDKLTSDETIEMLRLLLIAGNKTTANLIGNGVRALLQHPDQLALLWERPELIPSAVEELLRYDSPVQLLMRITTGDLEIGDRSVPSGTLLCLAIGSANHDSERFRRPDELDITRSGRSHISFGRGIHHCLGAPLARLQGRIALEVLLERFDEIGFGTRSPKHRPTVVLRGLDHLDVRVVSSARTTVTQREG